MRRRRLMLRSLIATSTPSALRSSPVSPPAAQPQEVVTAPCAPLWVIPAPSALDSPRARDADRRPVPWAQHRTRQPRERSTAAPAPLARVMRCSTRHQTGTVGDSMTSNVHLRRGLAATLLALAAGGCFASSTQPITAGQGPDPVLPAPGGGLIPTIRVAEAIGWADGAAPTPASGLRVAAFATGLDHPRW